MDENVISNLLMNKREIYFLNQNVFYSYNLYEKSIETYYEPPPTYNVLGIDKRSENSYLGLVEDTSSKEKFFINSMNGVNDDVISVEISKNDIIQFFDLPSLNLILLNVYNNKFKRFILKTIEKKSKKEKILYESENNVLTINDISKGENYIIFTENTFQDKLNIRLIDLQEREVYIDVSKPISIKKIKFSEDKSFIYLLSDEFTEYHSIYSLNIENLREGKLIDRYNKIYLSIERDIDDFLEHQGNLILLINNNGLSEIHKLYKNKLKIIDLKKEGLINGLASNKEHIIFKISNVNLPLDIGVINTKMEIEYLNFNQENDKIIISHLNYKISNKGPFINVYTQRGKSLEDRPPFILLHGGPHQQERPGYDKLREILVGIGYVVICPNYHGSSGYGKNYRKSSHKKWGEADLYDINLVYKWIIEQKIFDNKKIVIAGISYGAYLTLLEVSKNKNDYDKALALSGPVDLHAFLKNMPEYTQKILYERVGKLEEEEKLIENSPINYISNIKCPIFIAYGKKDNKIDTESVQKYINLCKIHKKEIDYLVFKDEGHSINKPENVNLLFKKAIEFLG
ncbi:S9 family peptidase [Oceanobacillus sp. J11TS1]|uniref:alpha/beta hydrolase family protein n=1 Tax=Oceanobacillus sp. J11TS1 TaxID=2807191 RepID=UPI001B20637B|nr:prolyl oligopeptidase family serine peptidase [Oceanobacillus sp. J11TS1]GIO25022.1 hypothetical protein J11TS1_36030 [Oceanobacillus sp. J11TS1]